MPIAGVTIGFPRPVSPLAKPFRAGFPVGIDGERSFKVWKRQGPRITLLYANPRFPEFQMSPPNAVIEVWGVVSGSVCARRRCE